MPITQVQTPQGVVDIEHPQGATQAQIIEFAAASQGVQPLVAANVAPQASSIMDIPLASQREIEDFSAMEKFAYEFAKSGNLAGNLLSLAQTVVPVGMPNFGGQYGLWASKEEIFGNEYENLTFDEKAQKLRDFNDLLLQEDFPRLHELVKQGESTGVAGGAGVLFKAIADPTILLPAGQSIKAITALGALYGGSYEATRGLLEDGEIDAAMTAATAVGGGVLGGVIATTLRKIAPLYKSVKSNRAKPKTEKQIKVANENVAALNEEMLVIQSEGELQPDANILLAAAERIKMPPKVFKKTVEDMTTPLEVNPPEIAKAVKDFQRQTKMGKTAGVLADYLSPIDDRIGSISRPVLKEVNQYDLNVLQRTARYQDSLQGFEKLEKSLPTDELKIQFEESLLNYELDPTLPKRILKQNNINSVQLNLSGTKTKTVDEIFDGVDRTLKEIGEEWSKLNGGSVSLRDLFFPRSVSDYEGLLMRYGKTPPKELDKMWEIKAKAMGFSSVSDLPLSDKQSVVLDFLEGTRYQAKGKKFKKNVRQFKQRKFQQIDRDMMQYYNKSTTTLGTYVREMAENIENAKLWKRMDSKVNNLDGIDTPKSINQLIAKQNLGSDDAEALKELLEARFVSGRQSMSSALQGFRNVTNTLLLGNFRSATTQLGDLFTNPYRYGAKESLRAMAQVVTGKADIDVDKMGLSKIIATEFNGVGKTGKMLDKAFALSFFKGIDRFGKNVSLQSAFNKHKAMAKTEKGVKELREEYGDYLGARMDNYIRDLQAGVVTPDAMLVNFTEIVKMQPLTPTQKTKIQLMKPDTAIFYMLKTYALRHLSMLKKDVLKEYNKGNYLGAGRKLASYAVIVAGGNATIKEVKNWEDGKGFDPDRVPDHWFDSLLNVLLTSRYIVENKAAQGDIVGVGASIVSPPLSIYSTISKDIMAINKAKVEGEDLPMTWLRNIPIAGRTIYNIFYGGAEEFLEREEKRKD